MQSEGFKMLPPPQIHGLSSQTFQPPPLDGSLKLPEIYDWHLNNSPNHPLFNYANDDGSVTTISWKDAVHAAHRAGHLVRAVLGDVEDRDVENPPICAIIASADTITYWAMEIGIMRAGFTVFPVSTRNSPAAVAHLLSSKSVSHIFVGAERVHHELVAAALTVLTDTELPRPPISPLPCFEDLYAPDSKVFVPLPVVTLSMTAPAAILHSSGSTAFPKPIVWTHYQLLQLTTEPCFGELDLTGLRLAIHAMPMYHTMGMMQTCWTACTGIIVVTFKPQSPAITPTPEAFIKGIVDTKCDFVLCVPSFVESWSHSPADVEIMKGLKSVMFGGGPLNKQIGDELASKGIKIQVLYGCTEAGVFTPFVVRQPLPGNEWDYFRLAGHIRPYFIPDSDGNVEFVVMPNPYNTPCVTNTIIDGEKAYATSDTFGRHPTKPGFYKILGRTDDQIMHSTGEKTNPGPLEKILMQDHRISGAVIFGRGKFSAGVVIEPAAEFRFDLSETAKLTEFRNLIWPTVERMNEYAPQHSRIFKEMILVASPSKPFTYTAKHTLRRLAIIKEYDEEIEALYAAVEETSQSDIQPPPSWNPEDALAFVRVVLEKVTERTIADTDDIFQQGCDSLQATWIRNSILRALRDSSKADVRSIPGNFVYRHPTIASLAKFVSALASPTSVRASAGSVDLDTSVEAMLAMVEKCTVDIEATGILTGSQDVVLVSGTTGQIGATLLATMVQSPDVAKVYAFNRPGRAGTSLQDRQRQALTERGLDGDIADSSKVVLLEADMAQNNLGLSKEVYEEIRKSVTHIIHNAWRVDFNLSMGSFEPNIRSLRNLIDMALSSPHATLPRILFVSSVAVLAQSKGQDRVKEELVEPNIAVGSGYGESKWVSERMLAVAAGRTALKPVIVRVGQVSGGSNGAWSTAEWVPSLVRSSIYLGCLPAIDNEISWVPADVAAQAIFEMRNSPTPVLHLAHPKPVPWSAVFEPIANNLNLPFVPFEKWLDLLEKSGDPVQQKQNGHVPNGDAQAATALSPEEMMKQNPALTIVDFFRAVRSAPEAAEAMGVIGMDVSQAKKVAPALHEERLGQLGERDALSWLQYWRGVGFV